MKTKYRSSKKRFHRSITSTILASFFLAAFVPIVVLCIWSYQYLARNIKQDFYDRARQITTGIDSNLGIYFDEIEKITNSVFTSGDIEKILLEEPESPSENLRMELLFKDYISNLIGNRSDFLRVNLCKESGEFYQWTQGQLGQWYPENQQVIDELQKSGARFAVYGPRSLRTYSGYKKQIFTVGRELKSIHSGRTIGYLIMDLDYKGIEKIIGMENQTENLLIISDEGEIYYDNFYPDQVGGTWENSFLDEKEWSGEKQYIEIESSSMDWKYLMMTDQEALLKKLNHVVGYFIGGGTFCFFMFLLIAFFVSQSVSKPLKRLEEAMSKAESNGFNEIVPAANTYGEVNRLTRRYNVMLVEIQRLLENEKELYRKKAESEYQALQLQITPHFLYNSLDSINCLAQVHGRNDISEMILSLADTFKYNMRYDTKTVTLGDEVAHVKNYCMLQAVHFQDRFEIFYEIDEQYLQDEVTKFMLQPLVENAINYGVGKMKHGGKIRISAYEKDGKLMVEVEDNGMGMSQEKQEELQNMFDMPVEQLLHKKEDITHIGLYNVNLRIKLQYGADAGMCVDSMPGMGTRVRIAIPRKGGEGCLRF